MSEFIHWRDSWKLDIEMLDRDHKEMAGMLNAIAETTERNATSPGNPAPEPRTSMKHVLAQLEAFGNKARAHFEREEAFMRRIDYPDIAGHKSEHGLLAAEFSALLRQIRDRQGDHVDQQMVDSLRHWLKDWMIGHVLDSDRRLADYYHAARFSRRQAVG
jgi:hemerythrin